jgi:tRNA threonylcarbamoyladenosine biosynthesis protein TsaB
MKFYMLVLALDTTTRRGSAAIVGDGALADCEIGDATRTYGDRLPGDLMRLLARHDLRVQDVDVFAVATGPGSLTGLRIGIATMQGLALATGRPMVGVSTLDALEKVSRESISTRAGKDVPGAFFLGAWVDAQRSEVFSALYRGGELVEGPAAERPGITLARWAGVVAAEEVVFVGDGALTYAGAIADAFPHASIVTEVPPLAPAIARIAAEAALRHDTLAPDAIRPIYVRRPDVELARDRRTAESGTPSNQ